MLRYHGALPAPSRSLMSRMSSSPEQLRPRRATRDVTVVKPHVIDVKPGLAGRASLRVIAVWEAVKGLLVILAAGAAEKFLHTDADHAIDVIVDRFHLDPAGHTSRIFMQAAEHLNDTRLVLIAAAAIFYALIRFVEAWGLWYQKSWGWLLGIASAGLYLPLEIVEIFRRFSWISVGLFAINVLIIILLWHNRTRHRMVA